MLTNLIENRGKEFSNILKIGDYLGRSLRENVELFYVDSDMVTFLTESGHVITGRYSSKPVLKLSNIQVEDSSVLSDREAFENLTDKKVSQLLSDLFNDDYSNAENTFTGILNVFETKLSFDRVKERLVEKTQRFGSQTKIINSVEFQKLVQVKDKLVNFLKENSKIVNIPEIRNSLKLASVVSNSFDLPKITLDELAAKRVYTLENTQKTSLYNHLCRQELISKELLEAKKNLDVTWAYNDNIAELVTLVYEQDSNVIESALAKVILDMPYFALATKKQINNLVTNNLAVTESEVSNKDITKFVSQIFEMKKGVKDYLLSVLNEKYGINVNTLSDVPSFTNLIKTEILIFNALGKLAPKNSVIKECLLSLSESLKHKNGVEGIDVISFLNDVFKEAKLTGAINETSLMQYLDFNQVADDLGKIGTILKLIKPMISGGGQGQEQGAPEGEEELGADPEMGQALDAESPLDDENSSVIPQGDEGDLGDGPAMDPEDAADGVAAEDDLAGMGDDGMEGMPDEGMEGMEGEEGLEGDEGIPGEEAIEPADDVDGDDLNVLVSDIEDLLNNIRAELEGAPEGAEDEDGGEFQGEEDFEPDPDSGDFDGGGEAEGSNEEFPEDDEPEEEEDTPPKKDKQAFKK